MFAVFEWNELVNLLESYSLKYYTVGEIEAICLNANAAEENGAERQCSGLPKIDYWMK